MNKSQLMDLVLPEGWKGHVDSAIPQDWADKYLESIDSLGFDNSKFNPNYALVWSYLEEHGSSIFGRPVNLLELLMLKIEKGELVIVPAEPVAVPCKNGIKEA